MRHNSNKIKVKLGRDANKMLMRKLAVNFLLHGKITTTEKKARVLKTYLERLLEKTKFVSESNKNYLLRHLASSQLVSSLFRDVGPRMSDRVGGYVKLQKLYQRSSDGTLMIKVEWSTPVVLAPVEAPVKPVEENSKKKEVKK